MDGVTELLIRLKVPITQRNWLECAYMGDKSSIEELDAEEQANLPEGFEDWPREELPGGIQ